MTAFNTKLGKTRAGERTRIWIEGSRLVEVGFAKGSKFIKVWSPGNLVIKPIGETAAASLPPRAIGTVSGKGDHPIIDITGQLVATTFGTGSHVTVTYDAGRITIMSAGE